ncbi:hypothetical protein E3A20_18960, partial [Planctomyces bekefii]
MSDLTSKSALELNKIFTSQQASAEEITQAFINRIEKLDKNINAFTSGLRLSVKNSGAMPML